jgi:hypothetical protein
MSEKEYVESRLPKYLEFRRFTVEEYYAIFELDCLPEGTSQELWDGIILEKYTDLKPRMFRQEEFEKMLAAGIIKPEELPQLADGFILHFCWHPAPNRFQPGLAIDQSPLPP